MFVPFPASQIDSTGQDYKRHYKAPGFQANLLFLMLKFASYLYVFPLSITFACSQWNKAVLVRSIQIVIAAFWQKI